jgi:hypothetical protein
MPSSITLAEIERIFEILDRLGISREAVIIPLRPAHPGGVRVLEGGRNAGKLEITVESERAFEDWLPELETMIRQTLAG